MKNSLKEKKLVVISSDIAKMQSVTSLAIAFMGVNF